MVSKDDLQAAAAVFLNHIKEHDKFTPDLTLIAKGKNAEECVVEMERVLMIAKKYYAVIFLRMIQAQMNTLDVIKDDAHKMRVMYEFLYLLTETCKLLSDNEI